MNLSVHIFFLDFLVSHFYGGIFAQRDLKSFLYIENERVLSFTVVKAREGSNIITTHIIFLVIMICLI